MPTPMTEICSYDLFDKGRALREKRQIRFKREYPDAGIVQLSASYFDDFNFVDHANVKVDILGRTVLSSSCDCPETQRGASFCVHRAALLSCFNSGKPVEKKTVMGDDRLPPVDAPAEEIPVVDAEKELSIHDLSYKFCNSARDLYPFSKNPEIPLERFEMIFGKNELARELYEDYGEWGGSCFGITATSGMFHSDDNDISVQDYNADAACPFDLSLSDIHKNLNIRLHTFIEAVHIIQFDYKVNAEENVVFSMPLTERLKMLCTHVDDFSKSGNHPILMDVFGEIGGHAVLPFKLEKIDQTKSRLHIYDPNWPNKVRYCDLTTDAHGNYLSWRFQMFEDTVFSSETGEDMTITRDEDIQAAWDNRAAASSNGTAMFSTPCNNVAVRNEDGEVIRIENGKAVEVSDGVIPIRPKFGGVRVNSTHGFYLPAGIYQVENLNIEEELSFKLSEIEHSLAVDTEAKFVDIRISDAEGIAEAAISEPEKRFSICLNAPEKRTILQGVSSEERAKATLHCGELLLYGLKPADVFCLKINNADVPARNYTAEEEVVHDEVLEENRIKELNAKKPDAKEE